MVKHGDGCAGCGVAETCCTEDRHRIGALCDGVGPSAFPAPKFRGSLVLAVGGHKSIPLKRQIAAAEAWARTVVLQAHTKTTVEEVVFTVEGKP